MRSLFGFALAGALLVGAASDAKAQFSISIGNPYLGQGVGINNGYGGYGGGYGGYSPYGGGYNSYSSYSSGYGVGVAPLTSVYSSGYSGYGGYPGVVVGAPAYVAPVAPVYGYPVARSYYGGYNNVYRGGGYFRPFYGRRW